MREGHVDSIHPHVRGIATHMPSIRRHLQVRRRWFLAGFVAFFMLAFALEVLAVPVAGLIMLPLFAALVFAMYSLPRCPRCRSSIELVMSLHPNRWFKPIHFCPYCGVHLDEPVEPPVKAAADIAARPQRD